RPGARPGGRRRRPGLRAGRHPRDGGAALLREPDRAADVRGCRGAFGRRGPLGLLPAGARRDAGRSDGGATVRLTVPPATQFLGTSEMKPLTASLAACLLLAVSGAARAQASPQPRDVELKASDGTALKATYFAADRPGPGVLLLHQVNRDRKSWAGVAARL